MMRVLAASLLSAALLLPASLPAQMTCSRFLEHPESVRMHYATGLLAGFGVAAEQAQHAARRLDSDSIKLRGVEYSMVWQLHPNGKPESPEEEIQARKYAHQNGVQLVADYLTNHLANSDTASTVQELGFRMAAECSEPQNASVDITQIFWRVIRDLQRDIY